MSVRLFILGLAVSRDIHGYEIKETARRWGVERWAKFGLGSIYHALGKLQEEGLLAEIGSEQEGNRPPRYVYRISELGQTAFFALLRETCRTADAETREIDMALAFLHHLPPAERVQLLTERLQNLQPRFDALTQSVAHLESSTDLMPWVFHGVRHSLGRVAFECEWLESVIADAARWPSPNQQKENADEPTSDAV